MGIYTKLGTKQEQNNQLFVIMFLICGNGLNPVDPNVRPADEKPTI